MSDSHRLALPSGTQIEEYVFERVLGSGNFGITYLARDERLDRDVAIKEFLPNEFALRDGTAVAAKTTGDAEMFAWGLSRFLDEGRALARLCHPNILRVLRLIEANDTAYMVTEYAAGRTLTEHLDRMSGRIDQSALADIVKPLLDGLAAVHREGYLHRDIKPDNIYLRDQGGPMLIDFGAARDAMGQRSKSLTTILTPGYAPPEQYGSDSKRLGPWTDVYAMAATMHRAITGEPPIEAPTRTDALTNEETDPYQPLSQTGIRGFTPEFLAAIDAGLALRTKDRPQSAEEFHQALAGQVTVAKPMRSSGRATERTPQTNAKSGFGRMIAMAAVILAIVGAGIAYVVQQRENERAAAEFAVAQAQADAEARAKAAEAEARRQAEAAQRAKEEQRRAEDARLAAEARAHRETEARERERVAAEAEAKRQAEAARHAQEEKRRAEEARLAAEARARQEAQARERERAAAEAEAQRQAEAAQRAEEEKRRAEDARLAAEARARQEAEAAKRRNGDWYPAQYGNISGPSFRCSGNLNQVEWALCTIRRLSRADGVLGAVYAELRAGLTPRSFDMVKSEELAWLKQRDRVCNGVSLSQMESCLLPIIDQRISTLLDYKRQAGL